MSDWQGVSARTEESDGPGRLHSHNGCSENGRQPLRVERLAGSAPESSPAVLDDADPIGVARRHVEIVQDGENAEAALDAAPGAGEGRVLVGEVEASDRLIEQQEGPSVRIGVALRQHARELHALAFAARQNRVGPVGEGERLRFGQRLLGEGADLPFRQRCRERRAVRARRSASR